MSIAETVFEKLSQLPEDKQQQVLVYVESLSRRSGPGKAYSFLDIALTLDVDGPADWARNFEEYLHGDKKGTL